MTLDIFLFVCFTHNFFRNNSQVLTVVNVTLLHVFLMEGPSGSATTGGTTVTHFVGVTSRKCTYIGKRTINFMIN